jgi:hypothetical protein
MGNLVALKFNAGLHDVEDKKKGHKVNDAKYPDFNQIDESIRKGLDWSYYVDRYGIGVQYDKPCGHKEVGSTPVGFQCCVVAVLPDFADAALALFPDDLTELTAAEFEAFYDDKAHAHEPAEFVDKDVMEAIAEKEKLGLAVPEKEAAIDVNSPARGIRKNHEKKWIDKKIYSDVDVITRLQAKEL